MLISVALCTYNGERYLQAQLDSLRQQRRLPDELVVSDDGSSDKTLAYLQAFARIAPFPTHVVSNPINLGYSRNFAATVARCRGDIIALCDQDDVWYPGKLARLAELFEQDSGAGGAFSDGDLIDAQGKPLGSTLWQSFRFDANEQARLRGGAALEVLLRRNVVTGMAFAFRRSLTHLFAPMPGSWIHDGWLALLIAMESKLVAIPEPLVAYRLHSSQQVGTPLSRSGKLAWLRAHGVAAYMAQVRERNLDEYQRTARQFQDLAGYLQALGSAVEPHVVQRVQAKADHARRGALLLSTSQRFRRWSALGHLASYRKFSPTGLRALPRDLLI